MKHPLMRIWRDIRFPLIMSCAFLPVPLILVAHFAPSFLPFVWLWPMAYVLMDALSTKIRKKWRIVYGVAELAVIAANTAMMVSMATDKLVYYIPAMYAFFLLLGLVLSPERRNERINPVWYGIGAVVHLLAQTFVYSAKVLQNPALTPVAPWLLISFFLFVMLTLVTLNQANLILAAHDRQGASRSMQRKNLLITLVFFGICLAITLIPAVVSAVSEFFQMIISFIIWLFNRLSRPPFSDGASEEESGPPNSDFMGGDPGNTMPQWLTILLTTIGLTLVAIVLLFAAYFFIRKLITFIKFLERMLRKYIHTVSEDYVDEITDTRNDSEHISRRGKQERKLSVTEVRKLTPSQRIRYRYRQMMRKHSEWDSGSTARENLSDTAASIYERVRYGEYVVNEDDAQNFDAETKKV